MRRERDIGWGIRNISEKRCGRGLGLAPALVSSAEDVLGGAHRVLDNCRLSFNTSKCTLCISTLIRVHVTYNLQASI